MASGKGRLNFVIPEATEAKLDLYCERTTRAPADVIRQLVSEWLEADRRIKGRAANHPSGKRTNIPLSYATLAALDAKIKDGKHATASAVITTLLDDFLANRTSPVVEEMVSVPVLLPISDYTALVDGFARSGDTIAEGIVKLAIEAAKAMRPKHNRTNQLTKGR